MQRRLHGADRASVPVNTPCKWSVRASLPVNTHHSARLQDRIRPLCISKQIPRLRCLRGAPSLTGIPSSCQGFCRRRLGDLVVAYATPAPVPVQSRALTEKQVQQWQWLCFELRGVRRPTTESKGWHQNLTEVTQVTQVTEVTEVH